MAHPHVGAGVHVSLSRLRPRSIDKQYTNYKLRSRNKQRTTSLFLCALSDGSPCYLPNDLRLELFSEVDGAKVWCERLLLCHSRGLRVPHGRSPLHGLAFARKGTSCRVRCSRFCRLRRGGRAKKSPASHRGEEAG